MEWQSLRERRRVHQVGTVEIKHALFSRMLNDGEKNRKTESCILREICLASISLVLFQKHTIGKKRYEKRHDGVRNEPLDTLTYAFSALYHHTIRAHRFSDKDWDKFIYVFQNRNIKKRSAETRDTKTRMPKRSANRLSGRGLLERMRERRMMK